MNRNKKITKRKENKTILITLHGGCFTGGSVAWDKKQTECFLNLGFDVHQLDFPKDNFNETIDYVCKYIKKLKSESNSKIHILGRSSGGYLAKVIFDKYNDLIDMGVYLAPVFNPQKRAEINPRFREKHEYYFRNVKEYPNTEQFNKDKELLFLAKNDENVPIECFTTHQIEHAKFIGIDTHKGMTTTTSNKFCDIVNESL